MPEWDLVSESLDGDRLLLGEVKWRGRPFDQAALTRLRRQLATKPTPVLPKKYAGSEIVRALFVPEMEGEIEGADPIVVTAPDLLYG